MDIIKKHKIKIIVFLINIAVLFCIYKISNVNSDYLIVKNSKEKYTESYQDATRIFKVIYKGKIYTASSHSTSNGTLNYINFE